MRAVLAVLLFLFGSAALAQSASLTVSGDLTAGAQVQVGWSGPDGPGDWIGLAPAGSEGSAWVPGAYAYASSGNPATLALPTAAGAYELRYVTGGSAILAALPVTLSPLAAVSADGSVSLSPLGGVIGGESLRVDWTGPNGDGDWVGLAPVGSAGSSWVPGAYTYTSGGSPAAIPLPLEGGAYELRYVTGAGTVRAALPLTVTPGTLPVVALVAMQAQAGAQISVALGPDAPRAAGDYLYIARAGAGAQDYSGGYATIPANGPVSIAAPQEPGDWELRYVVTRAGAYHPVGSAALTVSPAGK